MPETTTKIRSEFREYAIRTGDEELHSLVRDADRLARIESACLLRSEIEAPEGADAWRKNAHRECFWLEGFFAYPAPDLRPDTEGGITLPIIDA